MQNTRKMNISVCILFLKLNGTSLSLLLLPLFTVSDVILGWEKNLLQFYSNLLHCPALPIPSFSFCCFLQFQCQHFSESIPQFHSQNYSTKEGKKKKKVVMAGERMNQKDHIKDHSDEKTKSSMIKRTTSQLKIKIRF